jgi:uncharacterized membrane protein
MAQDLKTGASEGPMGRLKAESRDLIGALSERALSSVRDKVGDTTSRLSDYVEGGAGPGLMAAVTGAKGMAEGKGPVRSMLGAGFKGATEKVKGLFGKAGGGKGGGGQKLKVTNIVESVDVGVPIKMAYNQWTQFTDFPSFMKKVENVSQEEDQKLNWKAQVLWSHREWEADILEQIPDERIVWQSKGAKGHPDGAVTFHELSPTMTRILLVLEYYPQGLFEHTGNLWRAPGRRARLELKHFRRYMMSKAILHPEEIEGWRGVIKDGEVVKDHETALAEEEEERGGEEPEDSASDEELADEEYPRDQEDLEDEDVEDESEEGYARYEGDEEGEDASPDGQSAAEGPSRTGAGGRESRRARRPSGRPQRSGRSARAENQPQRPVRRRAAAREGNSG